MESKVTCGFMYNCVEGGGRWAHLTPALLKVNCAGGCRGSEKELTHLGSWRKQCWKQRHLSWVLKDEEEFLQEKAVGNG